MKQFARSLYAVALASALMAGCSKEPSTPAQPGSTKQINFVTNIDRPQQSIINSRVNDSKWEYGDMIGVYMLNKGGSIANSDDIVLESANRLFRVDFKTGHYVPGSESQAMFYPLTLLNPDPDGHDFDFVAYHPYTSAEQMVDYKIPVDITANKPVLTGTGKSKWPDYTQPGVVSEPVNLTFKHQMARIKLNVIAGDGLLDTDLKGMTITFVKANAKGQYNILDNKFEADVELADTPFAVTKNVATPEQKLEGIEVVGSTAMLIVIPNAGTKKNDGAPYPIEHRTIEFKIRNTTDNPTSEMYDISHPLDPNAVFEAGKEYIYNVIVERGRVTFSGFEVDEWTPGPEFVVDNDDAIDMDTWKFRRAMYSPNSYLWSSPVRLASTTSMIDKLAIPLMKAYSMWENNPQMIALNKGLIPDLSETGNENKVLTAEVIWADDPDIAYYQLKFGDARPNYKTLLNITYNKTLSIGATAPSMNMLIGLKLGEKQADGSVTYEDFYRWCWHVWVVPGDATSPVSVQNIRNYDHDGVMDGAPTNNVNQPFEYTNEYTFMGRNLGSKAIDEGINTIGMYYQWGRPTPFPGVASFDAAAGSVKLYKQEITKEGTKAVEITPADGQLETIAGQQSDVMAIVQSPTKFVTSATGNWIDESFNSVLWTDAKKSPWDPCPDGWRVPAFKNKYYPAIPLSPWNNPQLISLPDNSSQVPATGTTPSLYEAVFKNEATKKGYNFTPGTGSTSRYNLGWYPATGYRQASDGHVMAHGTQGYHWSSTLTVAGEQQYFYIDANTVNTYGKQDNFSATAMPVRCVKVQ